MKKLEKAVKQTGINHVALSGGVSANTGLRNAFKAKEDAGKWHIYIPKFGYTTDNAAMIAITGHYKFLHQEFCPISKPAYTRTIIKTGLFWISPTNAQNITSRSSVLPNWQTPQTDDSRLNKTKKWN